MFLKVKKPSDEEEKKIDPTLSKYGYKGGQASDKSISSMQQKENKPVNMQNEILTNSIKAEKEEQLKNLLIDYQDLRHKQKPQNQKAKHDNSDEEDFEEAEGNRVYAK